MTTGGRTNHNKHGEARAREAAARARGVVLQLLGCGGTSHRRLGPDPAVGVDNLGRDRVRRTDTPNLDVLQYGVYGFQGQHMMTLQ